MAGANSNIQMTDLDFNTIKNNLKTYLQSQDTLKDYNYEGSALSVLLDVLAYNTQYNAYYLNMVANEMFLDTALQRSSVVSQAKLMNYTPQSAIAPTATINLTMNAVSDPTLTLPKFTPFMSEAIDGINYTFVTTDSYTSTVNLSTNKAEFTNVVLKQGIPASLSYTVNSTNNPKYVFSLPAENIDTTTLQVLVQSSSSNTSVEIYTAAENYLTLNGNSLVYFLQENVSGSYDVSFGDGILGKKLTDGNIVLLSYITTFGSDSYGANNFVLMNSIGGYSNATIFPITSTTKGSLRESIDSIKYQAPKSYSAQKRAVTKEDYITVIQQNNLGYNFDAVNVWGGQENDPPVYGQVFVAIKPSGAYVLSATQKERLIADVIRPVSIMTVEPTIVDPDYTYIQLTANVFYDPRKTNLTASQIKDAVKTRISNLATTSLNTFNSTFSATDFSQAIANVSTSIITNEISLQLQKKFTPNLTTPSTYNLYYGASLIRSMFQSGVTTTPSITYRNPLNLAQLISEVYIEEVPSSTGGVETISVLNPGFGYQSAPTVTISGDGTGATAEAIVTGDGSIQKINVLTKGTGYTSAIISITPAEGTTTGALGAAIPNLEGRYGTLRTYYYNSQNAKTIFEANVGTIDYTMGVVTLNAFNPIDIDNPLGQLTVTASPTTTIISSSYNRIITIDPFDANAIIVNVTAKST
jgi:hypothetical protein